MTQVNPNIITLLIDFPSNIHWFFKFVNKMRLQLYATSFVCHDFLKVACHFLGPCQHHQHEGILFKIVIIFTRVLLKSTVFTNHCLLSKYTSIPKPYFFSISKKGMPALIPCELPRSPSSKYVLDGPIRYVIHNL